MGAVAGTSRKRRNRRFDSAGDAAKELYEQFNACTGALTARSVELSFGILAGNWAVYGNLQAILNNTWAQTSVAAVVGFLAINLFLTWVLAHSYGTRIDYADADKDRWEKEFSDAGAVGSPWPYDRAIENIGKVAVAVKLALPIAAGICFVVSLYHN
jgi:hypothetical protein